jgi:UDP-N-acetylmuramoylalanine--D-glutamate ligase
MATEGFRGLKATIIGAAREGTALARYLVQCGAQVTLSDTKPAEALARHLSALEGLDVRLALGAPLPDLQDVDVLFLSPGVPPLAPVVRLARERGVPISSEPRLFTQLCRVPVVGITGSSGKTTTTTLTREMYSAQGLATWVGGNIGRPLIEHLHGHDCPQFVVMELSSFQLELFSPSYQGSLVEERRSEASRAISVEGWSPGISVITNVTPNHLDRHPSMEDYIRAKSYIIAFQSEAQWAVLNFDSEHTPALQACTRGRVLHFSMKEPVQQGAFLRGEELLLHFAGREQVLCRVSEIKLRGAHNVANTLAAACAAAAGGVAMEAIRAAATSFTGVAHRLEVVRRWRDITFVNDSIATSPERAIAAVRSYTEPLVLLAGGRDKHLPWDQWAEVVRDRVRAVVAFGEAVPIIERALREKRDQQAEAPRAGMVLRTVDTLEQAVALAANLARPGDVVLLSPGGTSFDAFEDFEARGARFRELVAAL